MTLKKVMDGKVGAESLSLSALQPASSKQIEGPKKKLSVLKRGDYPKEGFPSTLTQLQVWTNQNTIHYCIDQSEHKDMTVLTSDR